LNDHQRADHKALPISRWQAERDWLHVETTSKALLAVLRRGASARFTTRRSDIVENLTIARHCCGPHWQPETLLSYVKDRPGHEIVRLPR